MRIALGHALIELGCFLIGHGIRGGLRPTILLTLDDDLTSITLDDDITELELA